MSKFHGYTEAQTIEAYIEKLLEHHPVTYDNVQEWLNFARTINTGLDVVTDACMDAIKDKEVEIKK